MANAKYIRGISGRGFRVKNASGVWKTVKEGAATNTQVDLEMVGTQDILSRERDNFLRVADSTATTVTLQSLSRRGLRLRPVGGTFTVTQATPAVFSKTGHGFVAGDALVFSTTGALLTGLTAGTTYYVIATGLTANAFQVSTTVGGSAVATTGTQSGTHTVSAQMRSAVAGNPITVSLNDGVTKRFLKRNPGQWVVASGGTVDVVGLTDSRLGLRVSDPTLTISGATEDGDLTFEALGSGGNLVTIELADLGVDNATEDIDVDGSAIQVSLAVTQNVQAYVTPVQAGANNDLTYTATAAYPGTDGHDITIAYVMPTDTNVAVPLAIDVTGTDIVVSLAVDTDGSTVTTTGDLLKAAILADAEASALVTVADAAANDGSGLLVAVAETPLANGVDYALSSTAAEVVTAIEGDAGADALVSVTAGGDGSGVVAVTAASAIGDDPEGAGRGEVITNVDLTNPRNLSALRRHFKRWVEN